MSASRCVANCLPMILPPCLRRIRSAASARSRVPSSTTGRLPHRRHEQREGALVAHHPGGERGPLPRVVGEDAEALDGVVDAVLDHPGQLLELLADVVHGGERDEEPQDVVRALEDAVDAAVAHRPLVGELAHVAVAAGDLQRLVGGAPQGLGGEDLGDGGLHRVVLVALVDEAGDQVHHRLGGVAVDHHVAELLLDQAELGDGLAELLPLLGLLRRERDEPLHAAHRAAAQAGAAGVQDAHGHLEALADLAEHVVAGDAHVVEPHGGGRAGADAHLVFVGAGGDAGHVAGDDEGGQRRLALRAVGGLGEDGEEVGDAAVGDPELLAVEDPVVAVAARGGVDGGGVGARRPAR